MHDIPKQDVTNGLDAIILAAICRKGRKERGVVACNLQLQQLNLNKKGGPFKKKDQIFNTQFIQVATAWGLLLARGATLDMCHSQMA